MNREGNIIVKSLIILGIAIAIVFGIASRVNAPVEEGLVPDEADRAVEEGSAELEGDNDGAVPTTVRDLPPPPVPPEPSCGVKNTVCETSDDCCGSLGLQCQEVRTSDGGRGKRCLPVEVMICRSDCENEVWQTPRACRPGVAPSSMQKCETFVGDACKESVHSDRNTKECWNT